LLFILFFIFIFYFYLFYCILYQGIACDLPDVFIDRRNLLALGGDFLSFYQPLFPPASSMSLGFADSLYLSTFHVDFCEFTGVARPWWDWDLLKAFNTFFLANLVEGSYHMPFVFEDIALKPYHYRDFNCLDYDVIYQHQRGDDFFFSNWYVDSYYEFFNTSIFLDFSLAEDLMISDWQHQVLK